MSYRGRTRYEVETPEVELPDLPSVEEVLDSEDIGSGDDEEVCHLWLSGSTIAFCGYAGKGRHYGREGGEWDGSPKCGKCGRAICPTCFDKARMWRAWQR